MLVGPHPHSLSLGVSRTRASLGPQALSSPEHRKSRERLDADVHGRLARPEQGYSAVNLAVPSAISGATPSGSIRTTA